MSADTLDIDLYWSVRSPYSYMATSRLFALHTRTNARFRVRLVHPHAVRMTGLHSARGPLWLSYFKTDVTRTAQYLGLPLVWPRPDPVAVDPETGQALADQPRLAQLSRLIIAAEELGAGMAYIHALSQLLWSPDTDDWTRGDQLETVARHAGLDPAKLETIVADDAARLDAVVETNHRQEELDGHWGAPVMVFRGEPFFGQDRISQLVWRLREHGLSGNEKLDLEPEALA